MRDLFSSLVCIRAVQYKTVQRQRRLLHQDDASCCRYAEKQVGYMACAILLNEVSSAPAHLDYSMLEQLRSAHARGCSLSLYINNASWMQKDEFLRLIINSIRNDLISRNESFQCLALGFVGNGEQSPCPMLLSSVAQPNCQAPALFCTAGLAPPHSCNFTRQPENHDVPCSGRS